MLKRGRYNSDVLSQIDLDSRTTRTVKHGLLFNYVIFVSIILQIPGNTNLIFSLYNPDLAFPILPACFLPPWQPDLHNLRSDDSDLQLSSPSPFPLTILSMEKKSKTQTDETGKGYKHRCRYFNSYKNILRSWVFLYHAKTYSGIKIHVVFGQVGLLVIVI